MTNGNGTLSRVKSPSIEPNTPTSLPCDAPWSARHDKFQKLVIWKEARQAASLARSNSYACANGQTVPRYF